MAQILEFTGWIKGEEFWILITYRVYQNTEGLSASVCFILFYFHLGVHKAEPDCKASELYELFRKLSFKILAATSSNLKFFSVCLSSSKTDVVLSQMTSYYNNWRRIITNDVVL
jgi:hypothetical protein